MECQARQNAGGVDADLLRHFERMKFRGSGIAEVRDHKCMACQVMLRPQTYNEVRAGQKLIECESCQRLLYFNPENEAKIERTNYTTKRRARPKADSQQAWFYHPAFGEIGEAFLAFVNAATTSSRRVYELHTGREVGDILNREGSFRLAFPEDLNGVIRLNGQWDEEEIDSWGSELPMVVLDSLLSDLTAARAEVHSSRRFGWANFFRTSRRQLILRKSRAEAVLAPCCDFRETKTFNNPQLCRRNRHGATHSCLAVAGKPVRSDRLRETPRKWWRGRPRLEGRRGVRDHGMHTGKCRWRAL